MKIIRIGFLLFCLLVMQKIAVAQTTADYLILNDIGTYRISRPQAFFEGRPPIGGPRVNQNDSGVLSGSDHFQDHADTTYKVMHIDKTGTKPSPEVQVTQHTGGDSDRWLLHEVEKAYRSSKSEKLGMIIQATRLREFNGNKIIGRRGNGYTWVSNNVVIDISYTDLQGNKPEALEVVQAYLAKFPSIITTTDVEFKSNAYNIKWIKDEMDRRLWLCDKWNAQFQAGQTTQADYIYNLVRSMEVFLNYRLKYYNIAIDADIKALAGYKQNKDITPIKNKLTEYKTWWAKHKGDSISLP